jgi:hypothetical protein
MPEEKFYEAFMTLGVAFSEAKPEKKLEPNKLYFSL